MAEESNPKSVDSAPEPTLPAELIVHVRNLRMERQWTQSDLAERANLSVSTVTNVEIGRTALTVLHLCRFADAFGISPAALLEGAEPPAAGEFELLDAVRSGDRMAALEALARALNLRPEDLATQPDPTGSTYATEHVADLGRNAARLARSAAVLVSDVDGGDVDQVLADWADEQK